MLTDGEKTTADNSYWAPAPQPYVWSGTRKIRNSGLGMAPGGETVPLDKLPTWVPEKVFKFPMVWVNPVTGTRSFQILPDVVQKLYLKSGPNAEELVVEDNEEVRIWLNNILDRICKPQNILIPEYDEGDVVMFNNWVWIPDSRINFIRPIFMVANNDPTNRKYCIAQLITQPLTESVQVSLKA